MPLAIQGRLLPLLFTTNLRSNQIPNSRSDQILQPSFFIFNSATFEAHQAQQFIFNSYNLVLPLNPSRIVPLGTSTPAGEIDPTSSFVFLASRNKQNLTFSLLILSLNFVKIKFAPRSNRQFASRSNSRRDQIRSAIKCQFRYQNNQLGLRGPQPPNSSFVISNS